MYVNTCMHAHLHVHVCLAAGRLSELHFALCFTFNIRNFKKKSEKIWNISVSVGEDSHHFVPGKEAGTVSKGIPYSFGS